MSTERGMDKDVAYMYTHNGILPIIKEWNNAICSSMNGPRYYHGEWSKSDRKRQLSYGITCA